jgi:hypothetical protein
VYFYPISGRRRSRCSMLPQCLTGLVNAWLIK